MKTVAVIGAGHAGVEAARILAEAGVRVSIFSNEPFLPYYRPRLIAYVFRQTEEIAMHPAAWYAKRNISLLLGTPVIDFTPAARQVNGTVFDAVLLCNGARPIAPFPETAVLWSQADAESLRTRFGSPIHLIILGGGALGLETASRALETGHTVTLLEKAPSLFNGHLPDGLLDKLAGLPFTVHTGVSIVSASADSVTLDTGLRISGNCVLTSIGARPSLEFRNGFRTETGICTDEHLQTAFEGVFAAGDCCQPPGCRPKCSALQALFQGRVAARNILAGFAGGTPERWVETPQPVSVKTKLVDFTLKA